MRTINVSVGPLAAGNHALIAASQAPTAGTALTLTGSQPDAARRIALVAGADAVTTRTFTLVGTSASGNAIGEVMTVPTGAATVLSALDYKTIISATPTGTGWSANVTLGTAISGTDTPVASSAWARFDDYGFAPVAVQVNVTGTASYTVETSLDDPNLMLPQVAVPPASMVWIADPNLTAQTTSGQDAMVARALWGRVTLNSATATSGAMSGTFSQAGGKLG